MPFTADRIAKAASVICSERLQVIMSMINDNNKQSRWIAKVSPDWICAVTSGFTKLFYCERPNIAHI